MIYFLPLTIMHHRIYPIKNKFIYKTFNLFLEISSKEEINSFLLGFEKNRPYSIRNKDYGLQDGSSIEFWLKTIVEKNKIEYQKVFLVTMPRVFGFGFNPVSFWLFFDSEIILKAVIADVNNTFGENHKYLIREPNGKGINPTKYYKAEKVFHVSPFFPTKGTYQFRFLIPDDLKQPSKYIGFWINYYEENKIVLSTSMVGYLKPLNNRILINSLLKYPFMTFMILVRIYYQATKLWLRGVRYYKKPEPPKETITS